MRPFLASIVLVACLCCLPAALDLAGGTLGGGEEGLRGSDDRAADMVLEISPGYRRWITPFWAPEGAQERWLFGLQAGLGGLILGGGGLWFLSRRRRAGIDV